MKFALLVFCLFASALFGACPCNKKNVEVLHQDKVTEDAWGYHLTLDCRECDIGAVTDDEQIKAFLKTLVPAIGMKSYGEPLTAHFAENNPEAAGFSAFQFIETSDITAHFVDMNGDAYIDIFSCKYFNPDIAIKVVQEAFAPKNIKMRFLVRNARD